MAHVILGSRWSNLIRWDGHTKAGGHSRREKHRWDSLNLLLEFSAVTTSSLEAITVL